MVNNFSSIAIVAFHGLLSASVSAFTPLTPISSGVITGNSLKVLTLPKNGHSTLSMTADAAAVPPSDEGNKEPLFEGFGAGIARDYKARLPFLKSDIKDGLNVQVRNC